MWSSRLSTFVTVSARATPGMRQQTNAPTISRKLNRTCLLGHLGSRFNIAATIVPFTFSYQKHRLHHKGCLYALESQLTITPSSRTLLTKRPTHLLITQQTCHSMTERIRLYHSQVRVLPLRKPANMYHILNCLHELPRDVYRERRITLDRSDEH